MSDLHSNITNLCLNHFKNLPKTGKPTENEWTILSCIVKENAVTNDFEVVSLGTGTKCIGQTEMSSNGDILNDSHAEIVCRRSFLRYLYEELNSNSEVFILDCDTSKFSLNDSFKFHFFTTHVPCGDAAIFLKQDCGEFGELIEQIDVKLPNRDSLKRCAENDINDKPKQIKLDTFRTGAKCLPAESKQDLHLSGSEYHIVGAVRTKPGRGDPTVSLSCSDKIAKWCHVGIQGALLSLFLKRPIYLSSFTIVGQTPFCEKALTRALFGRFSCVKFKPPYGQNKITIGQSSNHFEFAKTDNKNPCPSSITWCATKVKPLEVAVEGRKQGVTKKKQGTKAGRLRISKIELFRTFINKVKEFDIDSFEGINLNEISYKEAKSKALEYKEAWNALKCTGFKVWTTKDESLLDFIVD